MPIRRASPFTKMGVIKIIFFLLLLLLPIIYAAEDCSVSNCGNNISIRFPFRLEGEQPQDCGYPGFDLLCSRQRKPVVKLPYSGDFLVRNINYLTQQIEIYDEDGCIPRRLLSFNLSGSPFVPALHQNYTFLSCPTQLIESRWTPIDCLSNSTTSVLATSSTNLVNYLSTSCHIIATLAVPIPWPVNYNEGFSADLNQDLLLTWDEPNCENCEQQGGTCGFQTNTSQEIGCFYNHKTGSSRKNHTQILLLVCFATIGPSLSCAIMLAIHAFFADRRGTVPDLAAVLPQPTVEMVGLDESTIESYHKLVLGESRRLPGPNHTTCPICLSEYHSKETIRCIPECQHCFHADCIDEWLRMNNTCPVCRNSPSPAPVTSH